MCVTIKELLSYHNVFHDNLIVICAIMMELSFYHDVCSYNVILMLLRCLQSQWNLRNQNEIVIL